MINKILKLNTTQKKQTTENTAKQKKQPGLVAFYDTRPGNDAGLGLFYNAPEPTRGLNCSNRQSKAAQLSDSERVWTDAIERA